MRKRLLIIFSMLILAGCSTRDMYSFTNAALSKDPSSAFGELAKSKALAYSSNPQKLLSDIKAMDAFLEEFKKSISKIWGEDNIKIPQEREYVKYMQNYKSRALIDFDRGVVTVETLDDKNPKESLKNAIVTTLLLPDDPRSIDLFGSKPVKLGKTPYLLGEVKDDEQKNIRYSWRANRYADILINKKIEQKNIKKENKELKVHFVNIPMVKDHADVRVTKFKPIVQKYAKKYQVSRNLLFAIIQTESNFNQFAVSKAGAIGLMQIVPSSAGKDAYLHVKGKRWTPTKSYLFNAANNIELGSVYLRLLDDKYLKGIKNPISKEYCIISAYNTGSGNVLKTFDSNRESAVDIINKKTASEVFLELREKLPYVETRRYLKKVVEYKKDFINI